MVSCFPSGTHQALVASSRCMRASMSYESLPTCTHSKPRRLEFTQLASPSVISMSRNLISPRLGRRGTLQRRTAPLSAAAVDCADMAAQLSEFPPLRRRAIEAHGKATVACKADILGGRPLLALRTRPVTGASQSTLGHLPILSPSSRRHALPCTPRILYGPLDTSPSERMVL